MILMTESERTSKGEIQRQGNQCSDDMSRRTGETEKVSLSESAVTQPVMGWEEKWEKGLEELEKPGNEKKRQESQFQSNLNLSNTNGLCGINSPLALAKRQ